VIPQANRRIAVRERPLQDCMRMLQDSLRTGEEVNITETEAYRKLDESSKVFISHLWNKSWKNAKK
jgi:hypothetical protein